MYMLLKSKNKCFIYLFGIILSFILSLLYLYYGIHRFSDYIHISKNKYLRLKYIKKYTKILVEHNKL